MKRLLIPLSFSLFIHLLILSTPSILSMIGISFDKADLPAPEGRGSVNVEIVDAEGMEPRQRFSHPLPKKSSEIGGDPHEVNGEGAGTENGTNSLLAEIRRQIERAKRYPELAQKSGLQGRSLVRFQIDNEHQPEGIVLKASSGSPILDQEALETIRRAAPYPACKEPLEVWIRFELSR